jgi:uncharacterized protein YraI
MSPANRSIAAVAMLALSAAGAAAEPAMTESKVNLRSGPGGAFGVIAVMPAGTRLDMQQCRDEWCRVKFGRVVGYASRALLKTGAESYASAAPQPAAAPAEPKANLTGPHIWQWNNPEQRDRVWRDIQYHNRMR